MNYCTKNHSKFLLMYHIIFVIKYRQKIIDFFKEDIKDIFIEISKKYNFKILEIETDEDHIHLLIQADPKVSPLQIIKILKQISTNRLWKMYGEKNMKKFFYHEKTFWSDGYFCCGIGNACEETIRKYIQNQG